MGTTLSRWTMAYFTAALVFLIGAELLMAAGYGFPAAPVEAPETLILVHMVMVGWLSLLMCGALFQFVPVLIAEPLRDTNLVLPALLCLLGGLLCLLSGFLGLSGAILVASPLLAPAGVLLPLGFALALWVLARTLLSVRAKGGLPLPARFVAVGLASVAVTAGLGSLFALVLDGMLPSSAAGLIDKGLLFHAVAGFGGWLTMTAIGVSYRLLPMFMLSPEADRPTSRAVLWLATAALGLILIGLPLERMATGTGWTLAGGGALGLAALFLYGVDLVFFYRNRKRRNVELNSRSAFGAFANLCLSALLLIVLVASGTLENHLGALLFLVAFGWLSGLGLSQLYKIVPFLTWLECYGPVMGRKPTPRVQDLVVERRDGPWFALYFLAVLAGTAALLAGAPGLFRICAGAMLAATLAIVVELVLARRLVNIAPEKRLPEGTCRPRLFLPAPH